MSARGAAALSRAPGRQLVPALTQLSPGAWLGLGVATLLAAVCFVAGGGLQLGSATTVEIGLTLGGAVALAAAIASPQHTPRYGAPAAGLLFALAAFTAASVIWSVQPSDSWVESSRTLAYAFCFAAGVALVRLAPGRWPSLLTGVLVAGLVVAGYGVLTKIFPALLGSGDVYARLREPFGYWNAVGLTAALAVPPCLWLGARRSGHAAVGALAYPAATLLFVAIMLAYSRGALLALAVGCAFWFAAVPLRLRGLLVLALGALGAAPVVAWAFSQHALSTDNVSLEARAHAGHRLGLLLLVMCLVVLAAGLTARFAAAGRPPSQRVRYRAGVAVLVALALVPFAGAIGLAFSSRGLGGSISHAWRSLTDPHATTPPNDPSRLTAIGSVRARYWNDALKIFKDHPFLGVGAGGYPTARAHYRSDTLEVQHAHGYVVQTLADLGLLGLALSLLAAAAWIVAALRAASPFGWRARAPGLPYTSERIGLLTLITCVIVFTVHSLVDWTWFVPGNACVALLCAGWVAGRGPHTERLRSARPALATFATSSLRTAAAAATLATALFIAWSQWQPLRSQHAADAALTALGRHDYAAARSEADAAANRNPLSVEPLFDLAAIENDAGRRDAARAALQQAVRLQPSNARTWERLAEFDQNQLGDRNQALRDLGPALYLDPQSHAGINQFLDTLRGGQAVSGTTAVTP